MQILAHVLYKRRDKVASLSKIPMCHMDSFSLRSLVGITKLHGLVDSSGSA